MLWKLTATPDVATFFKFTSYVMKEVILNGRELANKPASKTFKISATNDFCADGHWATRKLPVVKGSKRCIADLQSEYQRRIKLTVGPRPIAAGHHDNQLSAFSIHCLSQAVRGGLQRAHC